MFEPKTDTPPAAPAGPWLTPVELLFLGAIWGASFLFMRVAAVHFGAFALVEVRLSLGALVLLPLLWRSRSQLGRRQWLKLAGIAAVNSAIPFTLFAWAAEAAPAGIGAIANATTVMFTAVVALILYGERINARRAVGLVIGFIGVVVLANGRTGGLSLWPAALAGTGAAFLYGLGANLVRHQLSGLPTGAVAAATLLCAAALMAPAAVATWPATPIPALSWLCAVLLGVLCTGVAYVLYYRLIHRIGAPRASTVTYLIPLFGVLWAWLALGEPVTANMAAAGVLILGGVALSQQWGRPGAARTRRFRKPQRA
ncbi:MAG TPA: DMT family transporter [Steroidobacteraceae bacterium]|jgi:drug/metabolite transporter (DMT)-like permease